MPFHVTQKGNFAQPVFFTDEDRVLYLSLLTEHSLKACLELLGWCLMTNHVHLLVVPGRPHSMASALRRIHSEYSQALNQRLGRSGHLWQSRYYSCPVSERHLFAVLRYIERNPVRAGLVQAAEDYPWSTARYHTGIAASPAALSLRSWSLEYTPEEWRKVLGERSPEPEMAFIRTATRQGKPAGDPEFVRNLEDRLGRRLEVRPRGRPFASRPNAINPSVPFDYNEGSACNFRKLSKPKAT
ncbi:MAG: transposase [Bryobacterales bacterium]|nr:transposase [Bryobacterales bacterium]